MNISAWSIRNPVPSILLFILLSMLGLLAFRALGVQQFPDMDLPTIKISATLECAAPSQLETEVARKIEDKLASLRRLEHINTTISDGSVSISVSFEIGKDGEEALNEVRNAVSSARANLPQEMNEPTVTKVTSQATPLLTYGIESPRLDEADLSWFVDNDINKTLLTVKGVASIDRVGGVDREIHIDLDPKLMGAAGVTAADVSAQLKSVQADNSGGRGDIGERRQSIRTLGAVRSAEELGRITLPLAGGSQVRLDQIARITDDHAERTTLAYRDGKRVIGFQIKRSNGYSDVSVANGVREAVARFQAAHPEVAITEASNTVQPIEDNYHGSMGLLYEGAILAVLVVWWFLRDVRATLLSAVALPLSILPTFLAMYLLGFSLNTISLLSLSLTIGILVDDAIVEVENIARHIRMGKTPYQAAMEAADEIGLAVIATTLTLVAVFLPTAFMSGIPGIIFKQFGITAAVAVLSSLLVARMLTPMMAAYMYSSKGRKDKLHHALPQSKAKRGRRARKNSKLLIPHRVSIHDRPLAIAECAVCGDWEGDLMAFSKPKHNNVVLVERKSRFMLAAPQTDKTAETTTASLKSLLAPLPDSFKRSITFDNGGEFARHFSPGVSTFFCDPHSPWQKGSVENAIGRLRRDLPRTTKPSDYTDEPLAK